jgi:hypothetical protein
MDYDFHDVLRRRIQDFKLGNLTARQRAGESANVPARTNTGISEIPVSQKIGAAGKLAPSKHATGSCFTPPPPTSAGVGK